MIKFSSKVVKNVADNKNTFVRNISTITFVITLTYY